MGHHIDAEGRFQSDKYPELPPDKVVISLKDPRTWAGLRVIAVQYQDGEKEFGDDLLGRINSLIQANEASRPSAGNNFKGKE